MATPLISRDMELPEILSRYPRCRIIFDRYGLTGCGGALGPQEPLWFFARAHRVDEVRLMAELEEVASADYSHPGRPMFNPGPADTIYQRFFKAAILTMFTFGCVMGGVNLAVMAARHQLASLDLRAVTWAHAHAQVAGWVTFFIMGFAYQAIPRFKFVPLWRPRLACATLWALAPALAIRAAADLFLPNRTWLVAGALAGAVEWAMAALFVLIIVQTIRQSKQPAEPYERFLIAALGWMLVAFAFDLWVFTQTAGVTGYRGWVNFIGRIDATLARSATSWVCGHHDSRREPALPAVHLRLPRGAGTHIQSSTVAVELLHRRETSRVTPFWFRQRWWSGV